MLETSDPGGNSSICQYFSSNKCQNSVSEIAPKSGRIEELEFSGEEYGDGAAGSLKGTGYPGLERSNLVMFTRLETGEINDGLDSLIDNL